MNVGRERLPSLLRRVLERLDRLAALAEPVLERLGGVRPAPALFERFHAFRWESASGAGRLVPIAAPQRFDLGELVGVERAVSALIRNTAQFVRGLPANHVLLYGERGTGKSSAVRGLLPRFAADGLRLVEVHKADLMHLPYVLDSLRGADQRFLLFCDDLSFDAGESGHRELKACLEGSLEAPPENVRVIATSNRRLLLPQGHADNAAARLDADGDLHPGEALEEKLALADRFGLTLGFYAFNQATYLAVVERKAAKAGLRVPVESLRADALRFALERGARSGRTARQFVDDLAGRLALGEGRES